MDSPEPEYDTHQVQHDLKKWQTESNSHLKLDVINRAYNDACYQFYKTLFTREFVRQYMEDGKVPIEPDNKKQLAYIESSIQNTITKPPYILLTVNPRLDVPLSSLIKKIKKFAKRKIVFKYAYVYEVRDVDKGLHCHMLLQYTCKPYDFKRSAKSTFKDICDVSNPSILNIKYVNECDLESKYNYLLGDKKEKKQKGVEATKAYRIKNKLQLIYESRPPLPCRPAVLSNIENVD